MPWPLWALIGLVVWVTVSFLFGVLWIITHRGNGPDGE
jgi:hypothetical protein